METGDKNRYVAEARNVLRRKLRFRAFPERVCPQIWSLESVDYFKESEHFGGRKKQNKTKTKQNKKKKTRILGCVPLRWSRSGSVIRDHSDPGRTNEPMNPRSFDLP